MNLLAVYSKTAITMDLPMVMATKPPEGFLIEKLIS